MLLRSRVLIAWAETGTMEAPRSRLSACLSGPTKTHYIPKVDPYPFLAVREYRAWTRRDPGSTQRTLVSSIEPGGQMRARSCCCGIATAHRCSGTPAA